MELHPEFSVDPVDAVPAGNAFSPPARAVARPAFFADVLDFHPHWFTESLQQLPF